jgi:putative spermidine/putrescine transport system substrate-binding protein
MSEEFEFDPLEYADQLGYTDELGRNDMSDLSVGRAETKEDRVRGMSRRDLLVRGGIGAAAIAAGGALTGSAAAARQKSGKYTGTLNYIALNVEWANPAIQVQAEKDLGVKINVQIMSTNAQVQKSITAPESFDVGGLYNYQMFPIWPTGNFQPVDRLKIKAWNDFYPVFTKGKVLVNSKACTPGQGDAPFRTLFLDTAGSSGGIGKSTGLPLTKEGPANEQIVQWWDEATNKPYKGKPQPRWILGPPAHFNMDSMGYNADVIKKQPGQVHWAELLNKKWKGRVALLNDSGIALQDAGNAARSLGLFNPVDMGNMTKPEIDKLIKIMIKYKKAGQFRGFWSTYTESVNLMSSGDVVIESMWSPAVAQLIAGGKNVRYAFPPEGMRGWCSCEAIPKHVTGDKLAAVYALFNWMHEGFMGASLMRQGYYIANGPKLLGYINGPGGKLGAPPFTAAEYDFWYNGKPAPRDLPGITGKVGDIKQGQVRDGGSFLTRSCHYSSWNSFFKESVYQVKRYNEFLSA